MKKLITILALIISASVNAQSAGDYVTLRKSSSAGDTKTYTTTVNDALWSTGAGGAFALIPKSTFLTPAQGNAAYSLLGHTHTFASLTSKPTTLAGYGITDGLTVAAADALYLSIDPDVAMGVLAGASDPPVPTSALASYVQDGATLGTGLTFPQGGLRLRSSTPFMGIVTLDEALSANRILNLRMNDAARTLTLTGDAELEGINTGDQDLSGVVEEDPGPGVGLIESGIGVAPIILKNVKDGQGTEVVNNTGSVQVDVHFTGGADQFHYSDISGNPVEATVTSFARSILDDPDAATVRSTIGAQSAITFGTGVQTALGVNIGSAGAPVLFNGAGGTPSSLVGTNITGTAAGLTAGTVTTNANLTGPITSVGNATTIADGELAAIAGLTSAADKGIQFTGAGTAATYDLTAAGKALLDDASIAAQRTTLGYVPATVVKMSSTARVNNTLTADPELVVALAANERISGTITLFIAASAAGDFKYRITGPAGPTSVIMAQAWFASAGTTVTNLISQAYNSSDQTATNASDFLARVTINFSVENGATPGNFAVEWAQNTTAAGNATSMLVGSQIQYTAF
jgi:hypothetical protein